MNKIHNERHMQMDNMASTLDILRELNRREALDEEWKKQLAHLEAKEKGLQIVMTVLERYAKDHWGYMTEVVLDHYGYVHCNLLVMTSTHVYTMEINHYDGAYEFKEGTSYLDGEPIDKEPIIMARSVSSQLRSNIKFCYMPIHLKVTGAAIFTNPDYTVEIHDNVTDIEVVTREHLVDFIQQMVRDEKEHGGIEDIIPNNISWVIRIDRHHPFRPFIVPRELKRKMRKGVTCVHCESFDVKVGEVFTGCKCGGMEFTEQAIVRSICQYGILNLEKELDTHELYHFFDKQVSLEQIEEHLAKHFEPVW